MRYSFRLAELLGHIPDPKRRPGTIKTIVQYTGLDRHQVSALLKNEVKYIPLQALSRLCDYLIDHGYAQAEQLPGALFAIEAENFWELLARRNRLELCVGVRREESWPEGSWIVASDSLLMGELLNGVSTLGGTARFREPGAPPPPQPEHIKQSLVWSPGQGTSEQVLGRAHRLYSEFNEAAMDRALVGLGSMKSNPVVEQIIANLFHCDPFVTQDGIADPKDRTCPLYLRYRADDPQFASCCGGTSLSEQMPSNDSGIYFETPKGWRVCKWGPKRDAAFVVYVHRESQGRLEVALGGYSGRATRLLARTLASRAEEFWPPVYEGHGLRVGVFILEFHLQEQTPNDRDSLLVDPVAQTKIHALDGSVIEGRIRT
jgi:hypothetical protein